MRILCLTGIACSVMILATLAASGQSDAEAGTSFLTPHIVPTEDQVERSAEAFEKEVDPADIYEELSLTVVKPVNLNAACEEDIKRIPFLTPTQHQNLFDFLTAFGEVLTIYELQSVPGFDSVVIDRIRPFLLISPPSGVPAASPGNLIRFGHHDLLMRIEQGFPRSYGYLAGDSARAINPGEYYPGNPMRMFFRYTYTWFDRVRIGIAGEKDPGEQFFRGAQSKGMDYYAGYLSLTNIGILKGLTIGNFRVSYGQGLTIGSGQSLGSVPGFAGNTTSRGGIRPSLAMSEGSYLRGLAATLKIKHFEFSGFASYHKRDATVSRVDSISGSTGEVTSLTETGYHRTISELSKRNALAELVCGGNLSWSMAPNQQVGFKTGLTGVYNKYSAAVIPPYDTYNQFAFRGRQNMVAGIDFQLRYSGFYCFGEISRSLNNGTAWLGGFMLSPDPGVTFTLICRNYGVTYQNLFSNAFGQNSMNGNERGIYIACNAMVRPTLNLSGYIDLFTFPWLKYRVDSPTTGSEAGLILGWKASANVLISVRYYQKNIRCNAETGSGQFLHRLEDYVTRNYRLGVELVPFPGLLLKTRIEAKQAGPTAINTQMGYFMYQEAQLKLLKFAESITFRFALFDIPDYGTRIYVYEPEVLYGYSVPAYQGQGMRTCLVLKFGIARQVDAWVRGGITCYSDRNEVGTGMDRTAGSIRGEATLQVLVKL